MCEFPWVLSNVKLVDGNQIADSQEYAILEHQGYKIGIMGIAEDEWIATLPKFDPEDLIFLDPVDCATNLAKRLSKVRLYRV